ncbi:MAG: hypothetical protein AAB609_02160 [Patescibacteria group bacterium]
MQQKSVTNNQNQVDANDLSFISDLSLRKKIIDAIETISGLYLFEQDAKYALGLKKEIRRVLILYSASIIEAVLLYLYNKGKFSLSKIDYSDVRVLPNPYQFDQSFKLVIAKQIEIPKKDRELMLDVLLKFFSEKKIISKELEKNIKKVKDFRNTFHLSKSRSGLLVSTRMVQISTDAVYETIVAVKNNIQKKDNK